MFLDNHGDYEIVCEVKKKSLDKGNKVVFVIEANDPHEAKDIAIKRLKDSGEKIFDIKSIKLLKNTRNVRNVVRNVNAGSSNHSFKHKGLLFGLGVAGIVFLIVIFVLVGVGVIGG